VLAAGRELARAGERIVLYRRAGRALPRSVNGPWDWPPIRRTRRVDPRASAAMTITPAWGLSAAPSRAGPFGRGGPWAEESAEVERVYGAGSTLHVSLEEFARTLTTAREERERFREGGVRARDLGKRVAGARRAGEREEFRRAFARFRAFDRPNVLHLFATFRRDGAFARAFPAAVQTGPLWPRVFDGPPHRPHREWVWYASPSSAEAIAPEVARGLGRLPDPPKLWMRAPRAGAVPPPVVDVERTVRPLPPARWRRRFARAELRIVTGSRTLLEALELGGPFLYFNGTLGRGSARRRHRPEKLRELLSAFRASGAPTDLTKDLADFGSGRRVSAIVERAARRGGGWARFPARVDPQGFRPPYDDLGRLLVAVARALARAPHDAEGIVARTRTGSLL
jgi:hypothetical protein